MSFVLINTKSPIGIFDTIWYLNKKINSKLSNGNEKVLNFSRFPLLVLLMEKMVLFKSCHLVTLVSPFAATVATEIL